MEDNLKAAKEAANVKAQELSTLLNTKVHPLVFKIEGEDEFCVGYVKEPTRAVKLAVMDKSLVGMYSATGEMLDVILLREHSDPRIYSERSEDDKYYLGAVMASYELIKVAVNKADKKK